MTDYLSLLGLGFGDCGKGLFTDHLCRTRPVHAVVRFNGGAQAGHNVVTPQGQHHTFSQLAAGSFVPGVTTVLAHPVVVHPTALQVEAEAFERAGGGTVAGRLLIDARCRLTTPFHQAAGRLREWSRGVRAHGSCGVGVGETVRHALRHPQQVLRYGDLADANTALARLEATRRTLREEVDRLVRPADDAARQELELLRDPAVGARWLAAARDGWHAHPPADRAHIAAALRRPGLVLFEGAQGVLLDECRGFHPHTTWSAVSGEAVRAVLADLGICAPVRHLGVLRSYLTRHGAGPLPTHDPALDGLPEPHNADTGWQGRFRRGQPDALLLRYALRAAGPLDGLCVSHLDAMQRLPDGLRWCTGYRIDGGEVDGLPWAERPTLRSQTALTRWLERAEPIYSPEPTSDPAAWCAQAEVRSGLPVLLAAHGPSTADVREKVGAVPALSALLRR